MRTKIQKQNSEHCTRSVLSPLAIKFITHQQDFLDIYSLPTICLTLPENDSQRKLKHFSSSPARAFPSSAPLTLATVCFRAPHEKTADEPMQPSVAAAPARAFPSSAPLTLETVCFRAPHQKTADEPMQPSVAASDDCWSNCSCCSAVCKVFVKKRERMEIQRAKNELCDE